MSKLCLYGVFHGNLNFSYVAKDLYPQIIARCYWPLLRIIEEQQVPLGLEFSGYTLEVVDHLDPSFVKRLGELWREGVCEVVGSGYVQSIMPLIPERVNRENLRLGNEVYESLLGQRPSVALLSEQVYSAGIPSVYQAAGYKALIVNWESGLPAQMNPDSLYRPCSVAAGDSAPMPVIWHSLMAYRDFQQYVEKDIPLETYLDRLLSHVPATGERAYPLYCSDWEVFDFKPWRVYPEGFHQPDLGEMDRIAGLLRLLKARPDIEFLSPSSLLERFQPVEQVRPESASYPLTYKKQELHGVARWAVAGRDSVRSNTECHRLYQLLLLAELHLERLSDSASLRMELAGLWKELCFLWNSDFRTFATEEKRVEFQQRMGAARARAEGLVEASEATGLDQGQLWFANATSMAATGEPVRVTVLSNGKDNADIPAYELELNGRTVACQVAHRSQVSQEVSRLTLETTPFLGPSQSGLGHIRETVRGPAAKDGELNIDQQNHVVTTPAVSLQLLPQWGGTIFALSFPEISSEPLISQLRGGVPQSVRLADYLFPGDLVVRDWEGRTVTDHRPTDIQYPLPGQRHEIYVPVRCIVQTDLGTIWKTYKVYIDQPRVNLNVRFQWRDVVPKSFRLGTMILNPTAFDMGTLYYATTNGGEDVEQFSLPGQYVRQDEPLPGEATARGCLGATEGWVVVGDGEKGVGFVTRPAELYSVPIMHYEEKSGDQESFLLTLAHSLGEWDETSHTLWRGHSTWSLSILGGNEDVISVTRACALLSNGGLVARSGATAL